MSKIITDENQLNTEVDDLITEDYALEVLGLKNPADFRKFSRSFMKLSKIAKGIENVSNKVANKTELGRVKIGDNLTITEDGTLSGNPEYTHPVGAGYKHIPAGGAVGQVLKNNGDGSAEWGTLDIKDKLNRGNLPATIPDADTILKLYEKAAGQKIDRDLLYLNDVGTKKVGYLYFDKVTNGLFECIKQTDSTVNSTEFFVEYSVKSNHDRLTNLDKESFKKSSSLSELTKAEITAENIKDLNEITKPFVYAVNDVKNMPVSNFSGVVMTIGFTGWRSQLAFFNNGDDFFYRRESNSIWYPWKASTLRVI